jgi:hypothetical protein
MLVVPADGISKTKIKEMDAQSSTAHAVDQCQVTRRGQSNGC